MNADGTASALRRTGRRERYLVLLAALPAWLTAAVFAFAWQDWGSAFATDMAKTIQLEFLVIHSGIFLGVFLFMPIASALFRGLRWVAVALLCLLYLGGGHQLLGWYGVLAVAAIFIATYGAFLFGRLRAGASRIRGLVELAVRWVVSLFAYMLLMGLLDLPQTINEWTDHRAAVALGALYFAVLGLVESSGMYALIRGSRTVVPPSG